MLGGGYQIGGPLVMPESFGHSGGCTLGCKDISLHLAQGDGSCRVRSVFVEDGVVGILPALVFQAAIAFRLVLDKAVSVSVAILINPAQRCVNVRPDLGNGLKSPVASRYIPASITKSGVESTLP